MQKNYGKLGDLELLIMKILWDAKEPLSVKEVTELLEGKRAYTTVMTTLSRLHMKGFLTQEKQSRFFLYAPRISQESVLNKMLSRIAEHLFNGNVRRLVPHVLGLDKEMNDEERKALREVCKRIKDIDDK